jgi:tetratricopeptide (TPR) repeat protein
MDRRDLTSEFVGRESELSQLERHLATAIGGQGHLLLVTGEAGIGKTFLIEHFLALTAKCYPDVRIARGQCSERFGEGEGYLPFVEALSTLLARKEQKSVREKVLEIVLDTAPSWLEAIPAVGMALAASYETAQAVRERFGRETSVAIAPDREHVLQEYVGVLTRLSLENPLLLFVDDLQWSDAASVDLLVHLSRRIGGNRILILGTYRPSDVAVGREGRAHPLGKAVLEMRRYNVCQEMALDRLGRQECEALVSAEFPDNDFPASLLELLFGRSEGNALFITEMLRLLIEEELIQEHEGKWHLLRAVDDLPLPRSVESVVAMRIDRLGSELRRALQCASVEGERFLSTSLARTLEMDELVLEELVGRAERVHRFVRSVGELEIGWDLTAVYQFVHILFQEALYNSLQRKQRVLLHRRTGKALEELYGDAADEIASELALHFTVGRAFDKALKYSVTAGCAAQRLYAVHEAIGHFERAQRLLKHVDAGHQQRLAIEEGLGDMRAILAKHDAALEHYGRARGLLADGPEASDRMAGLCRKTAMLYETKGQYETAFQWLAQGLEAVRRGATVERARIYLAGAGIYSRQGKHQQAMEWCRSGLAIARQRSSQPVLAHATYLLGTIHGHLGRSEDAVAYARQSLALYERLADPGGQIKALNNLGLGCWGLGDWKAAIDYYRRGIGLAERIGDVNNVAIMTHNLASILLEQGSVGAASRAYVRSLDIWEDIGFPFGVAASWSGLGQAYGECGEWERALDCLDRSERQFKQIGSDLFLPEVYRRQASVHLNTGQLEQARELVDRSLTLADELDMTLEKGISLRVSGQIYLACEAWREAEAALRESLEILRDQGNQYQMGQALYQLGRLYRAAAEAGDRADAARAASAQAELVLGEAKEIFQRLGAERALARVEEAIK